MKQTAAERLPPMREPEPLGSPSKRKRTSRERNTVARSVGKDLHKALGKIVPDTYEPRPIGKGAEHLVFEFDDPKHPDIVYKVNYRKSFPVLTAHIRAANSREQNAIEMRKAEETMHEEMLEHEGKLRELRKYFGSATVPVEKFMIHDVPISRDVLGHFYHGAIPKEAAIPKTVPAWVMIQRRQEIDPSSSVSLDGGAPEDPSFKKSFQKVSKKDFEQTYEMAHDTLLGKEDPGATDEEISESIFAMYPNIKRIARIALQDPTFNEALAEAVKKLVRYTTETGGILDFVGSGNILLTKTEKGWALKMPDPLFGGDLSMDNLMRVAAKIVNHEPLARTDVMQAHFGLAAIKTINALALIVGADTIEPEGYIGKLSAADWKGALSQQYQRAA